MNQLQYDDSELQGVAANVKLLLKLIHDHKQASEEDKTDHRRMLRVATIMTILDNVRERIQKCQSFGNKRAEAELRRCNTDLRHNPIPTGKMRGGGAMEEDEKERLRRELSASLAMQKRLQVMCSSLGKEKQIMTVELSKKVHELSEMEEIISNLKAHNDRLRQRVHEYFDEKKCDDSGGGGVGLVLQERNKALSEQLVKLIDEYRSVKMKVKVAEEENGVMRAIMDEIVEKVVRSIKERVLSSSSAESESNVDVLEKIVALERMFEGLQKLVEKNELRRGEHIQPNGER